MVHKLKSVLSHVHQRQRDAVEGEFKAIFYQKNRQKADQCAEAFRMKYQAQFQTAIACM